MAIVEKLKKRIIRSSLESRKKKNPFDESFAESFQLEPGAGTDRNNSYYFSCHDISGNSLFFRLGLRGGGDREIWFAYKDMHGNAFVNTEQLDAAGRIGAGVKCLENGSKWEFSFEGSLRRTMGEGTPLLDASFKGVFTASAPIFEFSAHMDPEPMTAALAGEKWGKNFKAELEANHQTHYEQAGDVEGVLTLGGGRTEIDMPAVRDHSFGKRDWSYMDRHVWLMALLSNGAALNVSMVRYPIVKGIQSGYYTADKKTTCLRRATPMAELPCTGDVPDSFSCEVELSDGRVFTLHCAKETEFAFPFDGGAYTIWEGVGSFEMPGASGRGILEFGFNQDSGRWSGR